jgi:hypothetical protein
MTGQEKNDGVVQRVPKRFENILPSKPLTLDLMETLNLFFS